MIKNLETEDGIAILNNNYIGRLAYIYQNSPFIAPITYYYEEANNCIIGYSREGHKINAMRKNLSVALQVDEIESVNVWKSALVQGTYEELHGSDAKYLLREFSQGVKTIIAEKEKRDLQFISEFSSLIYSETIPVVYRIKIIAITAKYRDQ